MKKIQTQRGFSVMEVLIVLLVVAILALGGWYAFSKMKDKAPAKSTTSTQPKGQSAEEEQEQAISTAKWLVQADDDYEVKIPDGWKLHRNSESGSMIEACDTCLAYTAGAKATIESSQQSHEGPFRFFFKKPASETETDFYGSYQKIGTAEAKNLTGNTYYRDVSNDPESSYPEGTKVYGYGFTKGENIIFINYAIFPGDTNQLDLVVKMIGELELK